MHKTLGHRLVLGFAALVAAGAASGSALAADGQLYFASIVQGTAQVKLDGKDLVNIEYGKIARLDVPTGNHTLTVTVSGKSTDKPIVFNPAELATAKGGKWWCAAAATNDDGVPVIIIMTQPDCAKFVDAGN